MYFDIDSNGIVSPKKPGGKFNFTEVPDEEIFLGKSTETSTTSKYTTTGEAHLVI